MQIYCSMLFADWQSSRLNSLPKCMMDCRIVALIAGIGSASFFSMTESIQGDSPAWRYDERTIGQASSLFLMSGLTMAVSGFFGQKDGQQTAPQNFALYFGDFGSGVLFAYATALGGMSSFQSMLKVRRNACTSGRGPTCQAA